MRLDVLVVDDNEAFTTVFVDALKMWGYSALGVADARYPGDLLAQYNPRVVFTDYTMPCLTGLQLAIGIKTICPSVLVVMVSAMPPPEAARICDRVFSKPIPLQLLAETLVELGIHPRQPAAPLPEEQQHE